MKLDKLLIRLSGIDYRGSICDGPGLRTVVFVQGCTRKCKNCHNRETWALNGGKILTVEECFNNICKNSPYKRITISGGEPLLQKDAVDELITRLYGAGFEIALYTSFGKKDVPQSILDRLTYLKTGEYKDALRSTVIPYVGSSNQIFEKVG